jgi:pimeloyl-ACP methyl ester carboxylesterase
METFFKSKLSVPGFKALRAVAMMRPSLSQWVMKTAVGLPVTWSVAKAMRLVHPDLCPRDEMDPYLEHLARLDLPTYFQLAQDIQDHDASDLLGRIKVPVLVFGADRDLFTPVALSEKMASLIPGAELCIIRGGSHAALIEQPQLMCLRMERFFVERLALPRMAKLAW